jgi:hypothetical protein
MVDIKRLLVRGSDLLILGVGWHDMHFVAAAGGVGQLQADGPAPQVVLFFPPQAIAETKFDVDFDTSTRAARLANPTRVAFTLGAGRAIDLTADALLTALAAAPPIDVNIAGGETMIEMPWRLMICPRAHDGSDVVSQHLPQPAQSDAGVVGLWHSMLRARTDGAALDVVPVSADQSDDGLDVEPLSAVAAGIGLIAPAGSRPGNRNLGLGYERRDRHMRPS